MVKGKKKKKDLDFQKVKLKVGRRLKKDCNETKAEFKTRKIILKEVRSFSDDPITALNRHSDHMSQHAKLSMLNHFNSALTHDIVKSLTKPILDSLSKFLVDHSDQVRNVTVKCLKNCFNHIRQQHLSTKDFMLSLKPYLNCAYTHVSTDIATDCQKFLEYFVNINDANIFEPLMEIVLRRYEVGNLSQAQKELAIKLKHYYVRQTQKQTVENMLKGDELEPLLWTETNYVLNLHKPRIDYEREVKLGHINRSENIIEKYLDSVEDAIQTPTQPVKKRRMF